MNIKELEEYLRTVPQELIEDAADITAETATEYFKRIFPLIPQHYYKLNFLST